MVTATIQIGNSDNGLAQYEWSRFIHEMDERIAEHCTEVHFKGGSEYDAPWQNACWVVAVLDGGIDELCDAVKGCREIYLQESVAVTFGDTILV